jgi:hypothetical protein
MMWWKTKRCLVNIICTGLGVVCIQSEGHGYFIVSPNELEYCE